jgi:hypothetical protein
MKKPTMKELREYADSIGFKEFDPEEFLLHYGSVGWYIGKAKMKNWKLTVQTWKKNAGRFTRRAEPKPVMTYQHRQNKINALNRRKAELMRGRQSPEVQRELAHIQAQLYKL